jgi:undecaprenyl pyrophosphate phosphatase UppP
MRPATSDLLAFGLTFVLVLLAVSIAMAWISRFGLWPFALYRLGIGAMLIGLAFL